MRLEELALHVPAGKHISDQVEHLLLGEPVEQPLRHKRIRKLSTGYDRSLVDNRRRRLGERVDDHLDLLVRLFNDHSGHYLTRALNEGKGLEFLVDILRRLEQLDEART